MTVKQLDKSFNSLKTHTDPVNTDLHLKHSELLKQYENTLRQKKLDYYNNTLQKIENTVDQGQFWSMWNRLNSTKPQEPAIQDGQIWKDYFENL